MVFLVFRYQLPCESLPVAIVPHHLFTIFRHHLFTIFRHHLFTIFCHHVFPTVFLPYLVTIFRYQLPFAIFFLDVPTIPGIYDTPLGRRGSAQRWERSSWRRCDPRGPRTGPRRNGRDTRKTPGRGVCGWSGMIRYGIDGMSCVDHI